MPRIKLTEKAIAKLHAPDPGGKQVLWWDEKLPGFAVLVSGKTNAKTYIVQRDVNGRTRRLTVARTDVLKLDKAKEEAKAKLADLQLGRDPKAGRGGGTLRQTLEDYLAARKDLRQKSRADYRASVERHLAPWLDRPLREIAPEMVEARHRAIKAEVERRADEDKARRVEAATRKLKSIRGKGALAQARADIEKVRATPVQSTGAATANAVMRVLRVLWNFASERAPALPANPVRRLRRQWYPVARRERLVRAEDLPKFFTAVKALPNQIAADYLLLLLFTGLRRNEASSLRWDDMDFAARVIRLPAARTKAGRKLDLPMTDFVRDLLVARRALGREEFVFPSDSKAGYIAEPKFPLAQVREATGIHVSVHDLRRTYVTVAESADISPLALKGLINHSLGNDVTSGYVQMTAERLREPAQKVADRMKQLCKVEAPAGVGKLA